MRTTIEIPNQNTIPLKNSRSHFTRNTMVATAPLLPEIVFITSYPPRECGIATYSQDLRKVLLNKFDNSFTISICAVASQKDKYIYPTEVKYLLETDQADSYIDLAKNINSNSAIQTVLIQHEFGLYRANDTAFASFVGLLQKPIVFVFHTVLPQPSSLLKQKVQALALVADSLIVMTQSSAKILEKEYGIAPKKITVIAHGTHLVEHADKATLKEKYDLTGRKILTTFGLLSSGKSIETTLFALPAIVKKNPETLFLIIGKTHPSVFTNEGEAYRKQLEKIIVELKLENHTKFINSFLPLGDLLEYLQLTDIYLFTSNDPNQAVSGTFAYAITCGCPIISTPIPHALEVLQNGAGIIIDFGNSKQLALQVNTLFQNNILLKNISANGLHKIVPNAWENSGIAHALLFNKISDSKFPLHYKIPEVNLNHLRKMTTSFGIIQFAIINQPDLYSGYTLDDNARALVATLQQYQITREATDLKAIYTYYNFIEYCAQPDGDFLNYVDQHGHFTAQNYDVNLEDSNGRALWALGYLISNSDILPADLMIKALVVFRNSLLNCKQMHSTRAMAFTIKGVYYCNTRNYQYKNIYVIKQLANRLVQMYRHEKKEGWLWFESYLTYANSILPEALLCAYLATGEILYKEIAKTTFDFLLSKIFNDNRIKVISNKGWLNNEIPIKNPEVGGEQPIDVAYTILALAKFYDVFQDADYLKKMETAFNWFLGNNHLHQIMYNPCTGGCYDGLEDTYINLNQGAESTVSYLMARFTIEKYFKKNQPPKPEHYRTSEVHHLLLNAHFQSVH